MATADIPAPVLEQIFHSAFENFIADLSMNACVQDLTEGGDPERLKRAMFTDLLASVHEGEAAFFNRYRHLGGFYYQQGLPYVEYIGALTKLHTFLIDAAEQSDHAAALCRTFNDFIERAKNGGAAGYLQHMLSDDTETVRRQIKKQIDIIAIKDHLHWLLKVIGDIRHLNAEPAMEFDCKECKCGRWLKSEEFRNHIPDPSVRTSIEKIHRDIHSVTKNIYNAIGERDYRKIIIDYILLVRETMYLYNELNINVTQHTLIENVSKDAMTGLLNRRNLDEVLKNEIRMHALTGSTFCIVMFDLDHFKTINDTCGHQAGDTVLLAFAELLKANVRRTDNVFRFGGEEFLAILPGVSAEDAFKLSEKIRTAFEMFEWEGCLKAMTITVSAGISEFTKAHSGNPLCVISDADENLYRAKELGRNRTVY